MRYMDRLGPDQHYVGPVDTSGLQLCTQGPGRLTWDVATTAGPVQPGSCAGNFEGASASDIVGPGIGTNLLFGGLGNGLTLQPLSVQTQKGTNGVVGLTDRTLKYAL